MSGTLLAVIKSINSVTKHDPKPLNPYTVTFETHSHVSHRLQSGCKLLERPWLGELLPTDLYLGEEGHHTSYRRFIYLDHQNYQRYWEYSVLRNVQPGTVLYTLTACLKRTTTTTRGAQYTAQCAMRSMLWSTSVRSAYSKDS